MSATARLAVVTRPLTVPRPLGFRAVALIAIWVDTSILIAVTPRLVPESLHHQVTLTLVTGCGWALLATACVALTPRGPAQARWATEVAAVWLATLPAAALFPATGTGFPPMLAIGPPVAALVTGVLCLQQAGKARR